MTPTRDRYEVFFYFLLIFENKKWRFLPILPSFLAITRKRFLRPPFFISPVILELRNTYPWIFSDFCEPSVYAKQQNGGTPESLGYTTRSCRLRRLWAIAGPPCAPIVALRDPALGAPRPLRGSSDALRCLETPTHSHHSSSTYDFKTMIILYKTRKYVYFTENIDNILLLNSTAQLIPRSLCDVWMVGHPSNNRRKPSS